MKGLGKGMLWYNLKLLPKTNLIICVLGIFTICIFFNLETVDFKVMATIGELYVSLLGIILIPGLAFVEKNSDANEIICSKALSPVIALAIRLFYSVTFLLLCIATFVEIASVQGSVFDKSSIFVGVFISALLLGSSGYIIGSFINNIALAYMVPFAYYGLEIATKGKYTRSFYLFSLQQGYFAEEKWVLFGIAILFFAISLVYIGNKKSFL